VPNLKWLLRYLWASKWPYILGFMMVIVTAVLGVVMTGVQKFIIDDVFVEGRYDQLYTYLLWFVAAVLGFSLLMPMSNIMMMSNRYKILYSMSQDYLRSLHRKEAASIRQERTGKSVNNFITDIDLIGNMLAYHASWIIMHFTTALILIAALAYFSLFSLVAVLLVSIGYMWLYRYIGKRTFAVNKAVNESRAQLMVHVEEGISATREVLAFDRRQLEARKLNELFADYIDKSMQEVKMRNRQLLGSEPFRWASQIAVLGYGGYAVLTQNMTIGTLVVAYQFAMRLLVSLHEGFTMTTEFRGRMSNVERLREMIEDVPQEESGEEWADPVRSLRLEEVSFRYEEDQEWVLRELTADIPMGKKVAFVGASGAGKSTISQLLVRFYEPGTGKITVNGRELRGYSKESWQNTVRVVFQEPYLFPDTIRTNLLMGRPLSDGELKEACEVACFDDVIEGLPAGMETEVGERGIMLSGGQRQRLAIARSVLERPEILILDEATSALDLETERRLMRRLDEHRTGLTTIVIAHRLSTIINADRIFVVDQGRVVEEGTHEELLALNMVYASLIRSDRVVSAR
jgi:ABC-type multidrug transport system fused ATPase/permease subunit